ncbi:MAG TPA: hypothetical protein VI320_23750 [Terracidiphilus sp.]
MCFFPQSVIRTVSIASFICVGMIVALPAAVFAQQTLPQQTNATALIGQMSNAFSGGQVIHQITLSGNAIWHTGGQDDSGPVTLTATMAGEFQMTLQLSRGQKLETQTGTGAGAACNWAGSDGKAHNIDLGNCWKPAVWFLPAISLQPSMLSSSLVAADLGQGEIGSDSTSYRHLNTQLKLTGFSAATIDSMEKRSATDIGLDPTTMLPAVLEYKVHPDNGASIPISIEAHYSNYQDVNGVKIPFLIQRSINNCLQLEITVTSAQFN